MLRHDRLSEEPLEIPDWRLNPREHVVFPYSMTDSPERQRLINSLSHDCIVWSTAYQKAQNADGYIGPDNLPYIPPKDTTVDKHVAFPDKDDQVSPVQSDCKPTSIDNRVRHNRANAVIASLAIFGVSIFVSVKYGQDPVQNAAAEQQRLADIKLVEADGFSILDKQDFSLTDTMTEQGEKIRKYSGTLVINTCALEDVQLTVTESPAGVTDAKDYVLPDTLFNNNSHTVIQKASDFTDAIAVFRCS